MKLCIISHTEHYRTKNGSIVGWGPTVAEINHLTLVFDEIYHVAMLHKGKPPPSALPYTSTKIKFVELPALGGRTLISKIHLLLKIPKVISIVNSTLKKADYFQLRTPTGIGVFLIPYLTLFIKKKGWYKYAGNWNQEKPPVGYALQRWMLKKQTRKVTINGKWEKQPEHCLTFENPCLTINDLVIGKRIRSQKALDKLVFCYVGRLETEKGVRRIIQAFSSLTSIEKKNVYSVHLVGSGKNLNYFKQLAIESEVNIIFHDFLPRSEVFNIYKQSHVFLMPTTASEGFPKVIAEAINFGCVPVVSNISSISQYVCEINGYILDPITTENLTIQLRKVLKMNFENYHFLINDVESLVSKFSFDYYNERIKALIKNV